MGRLEIVCRGGGGSGRRCQHIRPCCDSDFTFLSPPLPITLFSPFLLARPLHAADVRRWTGVRTVVEARDLLRTVFRAACDHRATATDLAMEATKLGEEMVRGRGGKGDRRGLEGGRRVGAPNWERRL